MDRDDDRAIEETKAASRADGRPPEEKASQDPTTQAATILEESEARARSREAAAEPDDEHGEPDR
ncbi:MAG TPA: hypothetical protein VHZ02_03720 [Acidimicrobiales bacterium]|nr:hypothetical protein [Acidimicrobiales bacterium]